MNTRQKGAIPKATSGIEKPKKDTKSQKVAAAVLDEIIETAVGTGSETNIPSQQPTTSIDAANIASTSKLPTPTDGENIAASTASKSSTPTDGEQMECDESSPILTKNPNIQDDDGIDAYVDAIEMAGLEEAVGMVATAASLATENVQAKNTTATMPENSSAPAAQSTTSSTGSGQTQSASNSNTNVTRTSVYDKNADYSLPTQRFSAPTNIQVQFPGSETIPDIQSIASGSAQAVPTDIRQRYMNRLLAYRGRLNMTHNKVSLEMLLENINRYADQLLKYIEQFDDSRVLTNDELVENQQMWETVGNIRDEMTVEIRTRLEYLTAGRQPNASTAAQPIDNRHPDHIRRMDAKITPFNGGAEVDRDLWPTFKAKFEQYYHKCQYLSDLDKFMKLDEFIVERSEAFNRLTSFDRATGYQDAWRELCLTYDNPRRQVDEIIAKFMAIKPIAANREGLSRLYNGINSLVKSLPRLNVDVSTWDPMIVHIGESKLDLATFEVWRRERNSKEVARLAPFVEFLQQEIDRRDHPVNQQQQRQQSTSQRSSTNHGGNHSNSSNNQNRSDTAGAVGGAPSSTVKSQIKRPIKCPMCNAEHHLYSCDTFRRLDLETRRRKVRALKVCENCLRPNCAPNKCTLRPCQNDGCGAKHNGLLCSLSTRPSVNAVREDPK